MTVNTATLVLIGWTAVLLLCLYIPPCLAQEDGGSAAWISEGEELIELPAEPAPAIAPDGNAVLDFSPPEPGSDVGTLAREITSRPEFQTESVIQGESLIERILRWLGSLPGLPAMGGSNWIIILLLAALIGLITYLIVRLTWAGRMRRNSAGTGNGFGKRNGRKVDYLELATLAAHSLNYRDAVRYRFLYLLQQAGLPDNQLLTNRQVERALTKRNAAVKRPLAVLITGYEDAWYGQLDCTKENFELIREQAEAVEKLINVEQAA